MSSFILTNVKLSWFGSHYTTIAADDTAITPFIGLLYTGNSQGSTITPLRITWLPLLTFILRSWLPLPLVA